MRAQSGSQTWEVSDYGRVAPVEEGMDAHLHAVGRVAGEIARVPAGSHGFGFDPVMYLPAFGQTFAELPTEVKNAHSHRGMAAQVMLALMRERWLA